MRGMKINSETLITDLVARTRQLIHEAEELKQLDFKRLNHKQNAESWSALECIAHLNLYGDFYLPEITRRMAQTAYPQSAKVFKSGWLGNYFANSMLPKEKLNKMKTFKDKNPAGSKLTSEALDRFIQQQQQMLELLDRARKIDLNRTRTGISISKWITLKLGDTFRVVVYHNQRHMVQARKAINF